MDKSMSSLMQFVENCTKQGVYNKNTGSSRVTAIKKFIDGLNIADTDIGDVNAEELVRRYANKFPGKLMPASLNVYRMRISRSIEDFKKYIESPDSFKPQRNKPGRKKNEVKLVRQQSTETGAKHLNKHKHDPILPIFGETSNRKINPTLRLYLSPGVEAVVSGIPVDLTPLEAKKIKGMVDVLTTGQGVAKDAE